MKILEARDGFIIFETDKSVHLSSFVQADGESKSYVAQVVQIKSAGSVTIASARILFLYNGTLLPYDKTLPPKECEIRDITADILSNSITAENPIIAGKTFGTDIDIPVDESAFNKKMLISVDDKTSKNLIFRNLTKQFNHHQKNVVILDTLGIVEAKKYTAGVDFKLPLDTASLSFLYEDCLNDATADSKSLIVEIFKDLSDYSKTVPFLPFGTLKNIVDDMVDKSHVFKLLVLKNKLAKFSKLGYFASNKTEVDKINTIINSKCSIIDLSKLDKAFQNRYLNFLYEKLAKKQNVQVILELSNTISKKSLKNIMTSEVQTAFSARSIFQYLNEIKNFFDNFIIMPSVINNEIFKVYNTFLKSMPANTYLIAGEAVNYIPLISALKVIDDVSPVKTTETPEETQDEILAELSNEQPEEIPQEMPEEIEHIQTEEIITETELAPETESNQTSQEEILANIEEKSEAVILDAAKDLTEAPDNMFDDEDSEDDELIQDLEESQLDEVIEEPEQDELIQDLEESQLDEVIEEPEQDELIQDLEESQLDEVIEEPAQDELIQDLEESQLDEVIEEPAQDELIQDLEENQLDEVIEEPAQDELIQDLEESQLDEVIEELGNNQEDNSIDSVVLEMPENFSLDLAEETTETEKELNIQEFEEKIPEVIPLTDDDGDLDEIVELNPDDIDENAIIIDIEDNDNAPINDDEIVKDVDKVFTTRKDDDISDSDLDFIDELNGDVEELKLDENSEEETLEELYNENEGILEEQPVDLQEKITLQDNNDDILETKNASTPIVPVYDADIPQEELVMSDPIEQGDSVTHAKYGNGIVEKKIKYGNKTLFSINFDNVGRRLLDPTLTEIKKA